MSLLEQFIDFLLNQKNKPSLLTVKNYKADIRQFLNWFEQTFHLPFDPSKITSQILYDYKKTRNLSEISIKRHTSSLHKFFHFLKIAGAISQDPLEKKTVSAEALAKGDPWMIRNFKSFLYECKKSNLTIKNYINDVKGFFVWLKEVTLIKYNRSVEKNNLLNKITPFIIEEYKQRLIAAKFSPATINRKLSSLKSYVNWAKSQGLIGPVQMDVPIHQPTNIKNEIREQAKILNIKKEFYSPLSIPTAHPSTIYKRILHFIRHTRPNWYKKYHSYSFTHYFHFAILSLLICAVGFSLYGIIFTNTQKDGAVLGNRQELTITSTSNYSNENLTNIGGFWKIIAANIKTGLINVSGTAIDTFTDALDTTQSKIISPLADTE